MPRKRQALIEFNEITSSISLVNDASRSQILISGSPAYFNYSLNQKLVKYNDTNRDNNNEAQTETQQQDTILEFNVLNPLYPITVDVINTICTPFGNIQKILINRKNGVQAFVQFDSKASALKAKQNLNNADVYSGCCTLQIEFAKINRLQVYKNDQDSWDYTSSQSKCFVFLLFEQQKQILGRLT